MGWRCRAPQQLHDFSCRQNRRQNVAPHPMKSRIATVNIMRSQNVGFSSLYKPPKIAPLPITLFSKSLTNSWPKISPIAFTTWESSKRPWAPRKWSQGSQKSKKLWWWNHGLQWRKILENWVSNSSWSKPKLNLFYFHLNSMSYCFISIAVWTYGNSRKVLDLIFL